MNSDSAHRDESGEERESGPAAVRRPRHPPSGGNGDYEVGVPPRSRAPAARVRPALLQQEVVERTGWSESFVSRTLERLEERDRVVRVRFGRENVVYPPNAAPDTDVDFAAERESAPHHADGRR